METKPRTYGTIRRKKLSHFNIRLMERFAIVIDDFQLEKIVEGIRSFENKPVMILPNGDSFHLFNIQDNEMVIFFDWEYGIPVTVYLKSWFRCVSEFKYEMKSQFKSKHLRKFQKAQAYRKKMGIKNDQVFNRHICWPDHFLLDFKLWKLKT